jgi:putative transcriptional regulator
MPRAERNPVIAYRFPWLAALAVAAVAALGSPMSAGPTPDTAVETEYLTGQLLVAAPDMSDPRFAETVIFIVKHDVHGAMGLVVNRVLGAGPIADVLHGFGLDGEGISGEIRVHYGGPVQPNFAFVLHSTDYVKQATRVVNDVAALTTEMDILRAISNGEGPRRSLFALGYAGWGPGQLESELSRDSWYVAPADEMIIFDDDLATKWARAIAISGIEI